MKVTVITPAYNRAAFLPETIESVLAQSHGDIEYILLDDGSTDNTAEVVKPYLDRLTYIRQENMGETRTVNRGYRMAAGEAVMVVNSDDPLHSSDAVRILAEALDRNPQALAAYPDYVYTDEHGIVTGVQDQEDFTIASMVTGFNITLGPGMLIRSSALQACGYRDETLRYTGDVDVSIRLAGMGELVHVPQRLATHRRHAEAASTASRGWRMAWEVARLMHTALKTPPMATMDKKERRKCLAWAHSGAARYPDEGSFANLYHLAVSNFYKDSGNIVKRGFKQIAWPLIPVMFRKGCRRIHASDYIKQVRQPFQKKKVILTYTYLLLTACSFFRSKESLLGRPGWISRNLSTRSGNAFTACYPATAKNDYRCLDDVVVQLGKDNLALRLAYNAAVKAAPHFPLEQQAGVRSDVYIMF